MVILRIRAVPGRMTLDITALTEYSGQGKSSLIQWPVVRVQTQGGGDEDLGTKQELENWVDE